MRLFAAYLLVLALALPASAADPLPSCCRVHLGAAYGSAVCVWQEDGYSLLVSNRHVWESGPEAVARYWHGGERRKVAANKYTRGVSDRSDLGLFWVAALIPPAEFAPADPRPGDALQFFGYRRVRGEGKVLGRFAPDGQVPSVTADFANQHGDSGSGVFDARGRLVGVLWGSVGEVGDGDAAFVPVSEVKAFVLRVAGERFPGLAAAVGTVPR